MKRGMEGLLWGPLGGLLWGPLWGHLGGPLGPPHPRGKGCAETLNLSLGFAILV